LLQARTQVRGEAVVIEQGVVDIEQEDYFAHRWHFARR